jgi:hypothetical protein
VYNERVFRGVDYAIAQAARFGIKIIIALTTYWEDNDGLGNVSMTPPLHLLNISACRLPRRRLHKRQGADLLSRERAQPDAAVPMPLLPGHTGCGSFVYRRLAA